MGLQYRNLWGWGKDPVLSVIDNDVENKPQYTKTITADFLKKYDSGLFTYTNKKKLNMLGMTDMYSSGDQKHGKAWWKSSATVA